MAAAIDLGISTVPSFKLWNDISGPVKNVAPTSLFMRVIIIGGKHRRLNRRHRAAQARRRRAGVRKKCGRATIFLASTRMTRRERGIHERCHRRWRRLDRRGWIPFNGAGLA